MMEKKTTLNKRNCMIWIGILTVTMIAANVSGRLFGGAVGNYFNKHFPLVEET